MERSPIEETDIWAYVSKSADEKTIQRVETWMHSDSYDKSLFQEITNLYDLTGEHRFNEVDTAIAKNRFFKSLEARNSSTTTWKKVFKYAAIMVFAISSFTYMYMVSKQDHSMVTIETVYGEQREVQLSDGSVVWLNASSLLTYNEKNPRFLQLKGEAFFEVAKNKEIPFVVHTLDNLQITALGTSFNIKSYPENTYTQTVLFTGKVVVTSDEHFDDRIEMVPNDQVVFFQKENKIVKSKLQDVKNKIAWKQGEINFSNLPFKEIAKDLKIQFNIKIKFKNKKIAQSRFTGSFEKSTSVDEILEALKITKHFTYEQLGENEWEIE